MAITSFGQLYRMGKVSPRPRLMKYRQSPAEAAHGFQIWVNHADQNRFADPKAMHAAAVQIPEVETEDYRVRIVHGVFQGQASGGVGLENVRQRQLIYPKNHALQISAEAGVWSVQL